jgi:glycosyltransferase involved in cell wall biosynthesis
MQEPVATARFIADMRTDSQPTISVVVAAYQAERWIAEALESILGQTRPPDEVVVIDDGSTDGTAAELERYADRIRILRHSNRGYQATMNRAIDEARGEFVALCGADDIWEPRKLEWQYEAIVSHPDVDIFFGHAIFFGRFEGNHVRPPAAGVLDSAALRDALYRMNVINTPSAVMRRSLFDRLGWFKENFEGDDYDYWFRCLRAGVHFYYDPRPMVRYRQHDSNITVDQVGLFRAMNHVRRWHIDLADDRQLVRTILADDTFRIGRLLVDADRPREARRTFAHTLRYASGPTASACARALAWVTILSLPDGTRRRASDLGIRVSRAIDARRTAGRPAVS